MQNGDAASADLTNLPYSGEGNRAGTQQPCPYFGTASTGRALGVLRKQAKRCSCRRNEVWPRVALSLGLAGYKGDLASEAFPYRSDGLEMKQFPISPTEMFQSAWRNRGLIAALVKRDVAGRYRGSLLGILWSFFNPIFMLIVYTVVFSAVFKAHWGNGGESETEFALVLFAGLMMFNLFAECTNRASSLILSNVNYVKKVVFPLEVLPWVSLGSALFHCAISLLAWLLAYTLLIGIPHATTLLFPLVVFPFSMLVMGLSWALASLGVFLRDVSQFVGIVTTALMFLSPIFYPVTAMPEKYRALLNFSPITIAVEQARNVLYWGAVPDPAIISGYFFVSGCIAWIGFAWFQKTRKGFADVL